MVFFQFWVVMVIHRHFYPQSQTKTIICVITTHPENWTWNTFTWLPQAKKKKAQVHGYTNPCGYVTWLFGSREAENSFLSTEPEKVVLSNLRTQQMTNSQMTEALAGHSPRTPWSVYWSRKQPESGKVSAHSTNLPNLGSLGNGELLAPATKRYRGEVRSGILIFWKLPGHYIRTGEKGTDFKYKSDIFSKGSQE